MQKKPPVTMQFILQPSCLQWRDALINHPPVRRAVRGSPTVAHDRQDGACFSPSKKCIVSVGPYLPDLPNYFLNS
ncbi:hypothetical protein CEXT_297441 [Caerostris extrusa]|uniref:Uncharacterized protein n=1 Tax=Caerostris extrusa TaxID=172846 RepID=A0AAV4MEN2_CAEEX|nr:hypothetical protein CEXT_297441 [Caerostris extrusa]